MEGTEVLEGWGLIIEEDMPGVIEVAGIGKTIWGEEVIGAPEGEEAWKEAPELDIKINEDGKPRKEGPASGKRSARRSKKGSR